jgi:hypothetical protein
MRLFNTKKKSEPIAKILGIPVIQIGKPNSVGNIYTLNSIKNIFENFDGKGKGKIHGSIIDGNQGLKEPTHSVEALFMEEDYVVAVTKFLDTRQGKIAYEMINQGIGMLRPTISGFVDQQTKEIIVNELISFDILPSNDNICNTVEWLKIK